MRQSYIHISESYNKDSIMKSGLASSKIKLEHHLERFKELNLLENHEDKALYTWIDSEKNEKFIKDMVYCTAFISPRNTIAYKIEESGSDEGYNYSKILNKFLYKYDKMSFDVYKIESSDALHLNSFHEQSPSDDVYNSCFSMCDDFSHDNKPLEIFKNNQKNIKIIGKAYLDYNFKTNKYLVSVK